MHTPCSQGEKVVEAKLQGRIQLSSLPWTPESDCKNLSCHAALSNQDTAQA